MRSLIAGVLTLVASALTGAPALANDIPLALSGERTQGALLLGKTHPEAEVRLNDKDVAVTPDGYFVIGFARKADLQQTVTVTLNGQQRSETLTLSEREYNIERVDGVPQRTVTPDPEQVKRTKREAAKVWRARQHRSDRTDFLAPLIKPAEGRISGYYGSQRILNGEPRNPHYGEDIAAPTGTPVKAPWSGVVTLAEPDLFYSGGTIIIDHGYRVNTTYLHLNSVDVEVGQTIEQGDVIGTSGATGRATGPHLDWRVNWGQERLDPSLLYSLYE